ncbi:MAG TPA: leucyl/phenylalanyl-tRNA--protein transferase [Chthonomonadaceae bacterium]|nr:leucyl/phenylalanyl-tRNA--protein transferase [Chthonomonadaceae bacterium]
MEPEFTPELVELAYRNGIFPMHNQFSGELEWYRPNPRAIIPLDGFHVSRSLAKTIRRGEFQVTMNRAFEDVMRGCADRDGGSWINDEFIAVYGALHRGGKAHSVEVWRDGALAGGTYGVALGGAFMAESMFHRVTDASKVALHGLVSRLNERGFTLLDTQYLTPHLASLGAITISHGRYMQRLRTALALPATFD